MKYDKITPEGTRDLLFEDCVIRSRIVSQLSDLFVSRSYREVITPAIEFYDVFGSTGGHFPQEKMYKLTDHRGRLLVIRPDCTVPIARLAATRLAGAQRPLRLYYHQNVYRAENNMRGKNSEIFQSGIELMGSRSLRSDLEAVELAALSLEMISSGDYRIELCHIGYFKALIDSLDTDDHVKEKIRKQVAQKNFAALGDMLEQFGDSRAAAALKYLPRLFGGQEIFEQAYTLFDGAGAVESLDYLKSIYEHLVRLGLENRVIIDLGLVNQADYYTGILFHGYADGLGEPVLSGGRYDNLIGEFGEPMPAIGFGINITLAAQLVPPPVSKAPDALVYFTAEGLGRSMEYCGKLTAQGLTVESSLADSTEEAVDYARTRRIKECHLVDAAEVRIIPLDQEERI